MFSKLLFCATSMIGLGLAAEEAPVEAEIMDNLDVFANNIFNTINPDLHLGEVKDWAAEFKALEAKRDNGELDAINGDAFKTVC